MMFVLIETKNPEEGLIFLRDFRLPMLGDYDEIRTATGFV